MKKIGFSTGALARGDVCAGVSMQEGRARGAIELSALREGELEPLIAAIPNLSLEAYEFVSVHAPSRLFDLSEAELCAILRRLPEEWPIVVHPNVVESDVWSSLGERVCIENMDGRKGVGRTANEVEAWMVLLPEAGFCLDVAHAAQIDPSMEEAKRMLDRFGPRLVQVHVSRLGPSSEHLPLDESMMRQIGKVAERISDEIPLIIESVLEEASISREIERVAEAFGR